MKKFSIILNVVLVLVVLFFVVYARIQTLLAEEQSALSIANADAAQKNKELAERSAADARAAEAKAIDLAFQLEICQSSK